MKRKKKYFSHFLEAPLVRQADGELKNTNGNLKEYFRAAQLGPNGGFNSGLSLHSRRNPSYLFQTVVLNNCGCTPRGVRGVKRPEIL